MKLTEETVMARLSPEHWYTAGQITDDLRQCGPLAFMSTDPDAEYREFRSKINRLQYSSVYNVLMRLRKKGKIDLVLGSDDGREVRVFRLLPQMKKTYLVRMMAFGNPGEVRKVEVPVSEIQEGNELGLIFKYGQNDFQPKNHPSVSVGDVIELNDRLFIVLPVGFSEMSPEQFEEYRNLPRRDRAFSKFVEM